MEYLRLKGIGYKRNYILFIKMGIVGYIGEKLFHRTIETETTSGFTTFKFVAIAGSISLILFGLGYLFRGLGSSLKPISDIVDELHDSDKSDRSENPNHKSGIEKEVNSDDAEESESDEK